VRWSEVRPEDIARVTALAERELTLEEWRAYRDQPVSPQEQEEIDGLLAWFARRYPTPAERLRYARRAYARWKRRATAAP
jgi:hypothetical protein